MNIIGLLKGLVLSVSIETKQKLYSCNYLYKFLGGNVVCNQYVVVILSLTVMW